MSKRNEKMAVLCTTVVFGDGPLGGLLLPSRLRLAVDHQLQEQFAVWGFAGSPWIVAECHHIADSLRAEIRVGGPQLALQSFFRRMPKQLPEFPSFLVQAPGAHFHAGRFEMATLAREPGRKSRRPTFRLRKVKDPSAEACRLEPRRGFWSCFLQGIGFERTHRKSPVAPGRATLGQRHDLARSAHRTPRFQQGKNLARETESVFTEKGIGGRQRAERQRVSWCRDFLLLWIVALLGCSQLHAQKVDSYDLDNYRFRLSGLYWSVQPSGSFLGSADSGRLPIDASTGFQTYAVPLLTLDLKVARKHHLVFELSPTNFSQQKSLSTQVTFQGNTYSAGASVETRLRSYSFAPGYRYDFLKRNKGHLGLVAQVQLLDLLGSIEATGKASGPNGSSSAKREASTSKFLPLPVIGLDGKLFVIPKLGRLFIAGYGQGIPFFGYGSYVAGGGTVGVRLVPHLDVTGGYRFAGRLIVHDSSVRTGITLTQDGLVAGLQCFW